MSNARPNAVWWPDGDALTAEYPQVTGAVFSLISEHYSELLQPKQEGAHELSVQARHELQERIIQLDHVDSAPFVAFRYLAEAIDRGNRQGWFHILPPFVWLNIKREESPYTPAKQADEVQACRVTQVVEQEIKSAAVIENQGVAAGRILLSLIAYSGVIITKLLKGIPEVLDHAGSMLATEPWVEVAGDDGLLWRRVFLDPLTRCLVLDYHARFGSLLDELTSSDAGEAIQSEGDEPRRCHNTMMKRRIGWYLTHAGACEGIRRPSVSELMKWFEARLHKQLPGFLVSYARGHYDAASLPRENFLRLVNDGFYASSERSNADDTSERATTQLFSRSTGPEVANLDGLSVSLSSLYQTLSAYHHLTRADARRRIDVWRAGQHAADDFLANRLAGWAHDLLRPKRNRAARAPSTVYGMITTIGRRLAESLNGMDPVVLEEAIAYEELYQTILDLAESQQLRRKIGVALYSFHEYLRREHNVIELEPDVFDLGHSVKGQADARLITEVEINRVDAVIEHGHGDNSIKECLKSIGHLGFYCGMRRGEVAQLRVGDINGRHELWIFIRPWKNQKLKTRNSIRRSPAAHLLPGETAQRLIELRDQRINNGANPDDSLWPLGETADYGGPQGLIDGVVGAIQSTVGDPSFRFHHLRHSFATRLVLWHWYQQNQSRIQFPSWFSTLREGGKKATRPFLAGRNYLFPIAEAMGHGSIDVTFENYVHLLDAMLGLAMRQQVPEINRSFVETLLGVKRSRAAQVTKQHRYAWEAYEAVLDIYDRQPGRPRKETRVQEITFSGPNALYYQAVQRQERTNPSWPIPHMIVDWPVVQGLCAGLSPELAALKSNAPMDRVNSMARILESLPDQRVLLRSGVRAGSVADGVPELSRDILKGIKEWAGRLKQVKMRREKIVQAATVYAHFWLPNTRTAVALRNKEDLRVMEDLFNQSLGSRELLTYSHQPDPGSGLEVKNQRVLWETTGLHLAEKARPACRIDAEAGAVVLDLDTSQWNRSQTTKLVGLRLLMVYLAMIGSQG